MAKSEKNPWQRFKFSHMSEDRKWMFWESGNLPGDSRVIVVRCRTEWFWDPKGFHERHTPQPME